MLRDLELHAFDKLRQAQKLLLTTKIVYGPVSVAWEVIGVENLTARIRASHCHKLRHHNPTTTEYHHSFICSTIPEWKRLQAGMAVADTVTTFKS